VTGLALFASGCMGGGGGGSSAAAPTLTHDQYVRAASGICRRYQQQIVELGTPSDLAGLAAAGEKALALQRREVAELHALHPPTAIQSQVTQLLTGVEHAIATGQKLVDAAKAGDTATVASSAAALNSELQATNTIARNLELGDCVISAAG
jgi:hypothetical protein